MFAPLMVDAEMVNAAWQAFRFWLRKPPRGDPDVVQWQARKQSLLGLSLVGRLSFVFAPVLKHLAFIATSHSSDWNSMFKHWSHLGYDYRSRLLDYGNYQYKTVLTCWAWLNVEVAHALQQLSMVWPTCAARHPDTSASLNHQGDLLEVCMALCRGENAFGLLSMYSIEFWRTSYAELCSLCNSVDHLYCYVRLGSASKRDPRNVLTPCPMKANVRTHVGNSSSLMADLVLDIVNSEHETLFN